MNPRWGFQCVDCWDGILSRDQIPQPIFPYEGTRKTIDPVTNTLLEGTGATSVEGLEPTYTYVFVDRVTGIWYSVDFNASVLDPSIVTEYPDTQMSALDYIEVNNEFRIYVANGALQAQTTRPSSCPNPTASWLKVCDLGAAFIRVTPGGTIFYTPPGSEEEVVNPEQEICVADVHLVEENFEEDICPTPNQVVDEDFENDLCPTPDQVVAETFET